MEEMLMVAQLFILNEIGGIVLPSNSLVISNLQPLLHYEAVIFSPESEEDTLADMVIGGHKGARLWQMAINMYMERGMEGGHPIREVVRRLPEVITRIGVRENVQEVGLDISRGGKVKIGGRETWPLLVGRGERGLMDLFTYCLVIMKREGMDRSTVKTLGERMDNLGMILRRVWFTI